MLIGIYSRWFIKKPKLFLPVSAQLMYVNYRYIGVCHMEVKNILVRHYDNGFPAKIAIYRDLL